MTSATSTAVAQGGPGWLYSRSFDSFFIFGIAGLAAITGLVCMYAPSLFMPVMIANVWLLGYQHVIATFTRLCFDKESHRRSRLLIYALFPAILGAVIFLSKTAGVWSLATIYLYAQWFHYARQSWGVSRAYERNAPEGYVADRSWQTQVAFYSFPVWGILYRSWQAPDKFLTLNLKVLPVTHEVVVAAGVISMFFFGLWLVRMYRDWRRKVLPKAYAAYMLTHFGMFALGYLLMPTLDQGWLIVNIWHNLQYVTFVWLFNNRRYRGGIDPNAKFLSSLSQKKNVVSYFLFCILVTTAVYVLVAYSSMTVLSFLPLMVLYMAINFHHYIVDAIIWRMSWIRGGKSAVAQAAT